jgi:hypothetical protein
VDSPLGRFLGLYVMKEILPLKPTSVEMFWLRMKCSVHPSSLYFRKLLTFSVLVLRRFRGLYCLYHQGDESLQTSETLVNSYQSACCYNPEDSHLHGL